MITFRLLEFAGGDTSARRTPPTRGGHRLEQRPFARGEMERSDKGGVASERAWTASDVHGVAGKAQRPIVASGQIHVAVRPGRPLERRAVANDRTRHHLTEQYPEVAPYDDRRRVGRVRGVEARPDLLQVALGDLLAHDLGQRAGAQDDFREGPVSDSPH